MQDSGYRDAGCRDAGCRDAGCRMQVTTDTGFRIHDPRCRIKGARIEDARFREYSTWDKDSKRGLKIEL